MEFIEITTFEQREYLRKIIHPIWINTYSKIIYMEQVEYLFEKYFDDNNIINRQKEGYKYLFGISNGEIVSFLSYQIRENYTYIDKVYVLENHRRKGYASNMLSYMKEKSSKLELNVNVNNVSAVKTYLKNGFRIKEKQLIKLENDFINEDYIMEY